MTSKRIKVEERSPQGIGYCLEGRRHKKVHRKYPQIGRIEFPVAIKQAYYKCDHIDEKTGYVGNII